MKRKIRNVLLLTAVIVMCFSVTVLAGEKSDTKSYGDFQISCYISCTTKTGKSTTIGASYGYKNAANVIIRDANGVSLGGDSVTTPYDFVATAQKTNSGGKVKSALSGHYVKDSDGNPAAPLHQQVNLTQTP